MERTVHILIQTTTPARPDDWSIESLALLGQHFGSLQEPGIRFEVIARNREAGPDGSDPVLASLDRAPFDELWLFALDLGDGITAAECEAIPPARWRHPRHARPCGHGLLALQARGNRRRTPFPQPQSGTGPPASRGGR